MQRTLIVLTVLAALGAYVYWVEIKGTEQEEKAERIDARLFTFDKQQVERVEIENEQGRVVLTQRGGEWRMTQPVSAAADAPAVDSLLAALSGAEKIDDVSQPAELSSYGLEPPKATASIGVNEETTTWQMGGRSPVSQNVYVKRPGEPTVYQASSSLESALGREPSAFRRKRLFAFSGDEVTSVVIDGPHGKLSLVRSNDDWRVVEPKPFDSDNALSRGIAQDLANLRANDWVVEHAGPSDLAPHGLNRPAATITASLINGEQRTLLIGNKEGGNRAAMVKGTPQIVTIADWSADQLIKKPVELRRRDLFDAEPEKIGKLVFETGEKQLVLAQAGDGWSVSDGGEAKASDAKVHALLDALEGLRATEWVEVSKGERRRHALNPPLRTVTAYGIDGKQLEQLHFGNEADGWAVWVQKEDTKAAAKVANDFIKNKWPDDASDLGGSAP